VDPLHDEPHLGPARYATNGLCVAHGSAGVLHALNRAGVALPEGALDRLARQSFDQADSLPPGLHTGLSGIAWVLADAGMPSEASKLLDLADGHVLLDAGGSDSATLGHGRAGVGLTHLALHRHTGDEEHLRRALAHAEATQRSIVDGLGAHNAGGLLSGRAGIALLYYYLSRALGDDELLDNGLRLLHRELDNAREVEGGLLLPVSERDQRMMPYLYAGTAGLIFVASRYLALREDDRLTTALPLMLTAAACSFTRYAGLYAGMAGLGLTLVDHGERHAHDESIVEAQRIGRRMFMYTVPRPAGTYVLGEYSLRLSTDLSYGSAGVLLFLDQLLHRRADPFFTLDASPRPEGGDTQ
jgi:lantibiotic modifying enzyme